MIHQELPSGRPHSDSANRIAVAPAVRAVREATGATGLGGSWSTLWSRFILLGQPVWRVSGGVRRTLAGHPCGGLIRMFIIQHDWGTARLPDNVDDVVGRCLGPSRCSPRLLGANALSPSGTSGNPTVARWVTRTLTVAEYRALGLSALLLPLLPRAPVLLVSGRRTSSSSHTVSVRLPLAEEGMGSVRLNNLMLLVVGVPRLPDRLAHGVDGHLPSVVAGALGVWLSMSSHFEGAYWTRAAMNAHHAPGAVSRSRPSAGAALVHRTSATTTSLFDPIPNSAAGATASPLLQPRRSCTLDELKSMP